VILTDAVARVPGRIGETPDAFRPPQADNVKSASAIPGRLFAGAEPPFQG
jgi:hypothetical protein